eukprot:COSAG02_NODE_26934_length_620_cov_2.547025_2_plen_21_part_01
MLDMPDYTHVVEVRLKDVTTA